MYLHFIGGNIGDCIGDTFQITSPGNVASPVICGFNTGQHSEFKITLTNLAHLWQLCTAMMNWVQRWVEFVVY